MLSRFNLDVKRMYYYDNNEKFNEEFILSKSMDNKEDCLLDIDSSIILLVKKGSLKVSLNEKDFYKSILLYSNQSLSLLKGDKIKIFKYKNIISSFDFFNTKNE